MTLCDEENLLQVLKEEKTTKICSKCLEEKDVRNFYRAKSNKDGLQKWCKKCDNDRSLPRTRARSRKLGKKERAIPQRLANELKKKGMKRCPTCNEIKELESFYTSGNSNGGYSSHCIICSSQVDNRELNKKYYKRDSLKHRDRKLQKKFGITLLQYSEKLNEQNGVCAICFGTDNGKSLAVDHDHTTGQVRGLLCGRCNPAIGYLRDSAELARRVAVYLEQYKEATVQTVGN